MSDWSTPYYGIIHRLIDRAPGVPRQQLTVDDRGTFVEGILLDLDSDTPFTAAYEKVFPAGHVDEAKKWLEKKARV